VGIAHHRGLDWAQLVGDAHPAKAELIIIVTTLNFKLSFVRPTKKPLNPWRALRLCEIINKAISDWQF